MDENTIKLVFHAEDEFGEYSLSTVNRKADDEYETPLDFFFHQFNIFLSQCGFVREHGHILTECLTSRELGMVEAYLESLRKGADIA